MLGNRIKFRKIDYNEFRENLESQVKKSGLQSLTEDFRAIS